LNSGIDLFGDSIGTGTEVIGVSGLCLKVVLISESQLTRGSVIGLDSLIGPE